MQAKTQGRIERTFDWLVQPNASLNDLRDLYADIATTDPTMAGYCEPALHRAYNPGGKTLLCKWLRSSNGIGDKLNTTQQAARKLAALLE